MKKQLLSLLAVGALLASCTDDPMNGGGNGLPQDDGRGVFINATIALPSAGSRSYTDENGASNGSSQSSNPDIVSDPLVEGDSIEYGFAFENEVRSVCLVITDEKDQYLTHVTVTGMAQALTEENSYTFDAKARIPYDVLEEAYQPGGLFWLCKEEGPDVRIYAYCNFTQNLLNKFNDYQKEVAALDTTLRTESKLTEWREFKGYVEEKASMAGETPISTPSIWSPRSFLMSNSAKFTTTFPHSIDKWDEYSDDKHPFQVSTPANPIPVQRVAARIDFRDASNYQDKEGQKQPNTYPIYVNTALFDEAMAVDDELMGVADDKGNKNFYSVQLTRMILVNMNKDFYYLKRVSEDGTMNSTVTYCGTETGTHPYVVDVHADKKAEVGGINVSNASTYFNFPLYKEVEATDGFDFKAVFSYNNMNNNYGWFIKDISEVLSGRDDNWGGSETYKVWRYVTENAIPGIDQQKTIQSTGIIFKAAIRPGNDIDLRRDEATGERYVSEAVQKALEAMLKNETPTEKPTIDGEQLPAIYSFHNLLYAGVPDIVRAAKEDGPGGSLYFAVDQILNNWYYDRTSQVGDGQKKMFEYKANGLTDEEKKSGNFVQLTLIIADEILNHNKPGDGSHDFSEGYDINLKNASLPADDPLYEFNNSQFIELCTGMGITCFIPTNDDYEGWGYYCYYFYWNRHNDNGLSGKMDKMEFATVRNNVYKLAVTKINSIGHPRDTRRDPDPVTPEEPDEKPERSIEVNVKVLPWVVRVNNIEF